MSKSEMSDFYCVLCGNKGMPVWRKRGKLREAGHLKKLYCLHCKKQTNHVEIKPYTYYDLEDFKFEFENHNFDEEGNRILSMKELKEKVRNERRNAKSMVVSGSPRER